MKKVIFEMQYLQGSLQIELILYLLLSCLLEGKPTNAMDVEKPSVKAHPLLDITGLIVEISLMNIN